MKRTVVLSLFVVVSLVFATMAYGVDLIADGGEWNEGVGPGGINVGSVVSNVGYVWDSGSSTYTAEIVLTITTVGDWELMGAHAAAGETADDIPQNKNNNPKTGKFEASWKAANTDGQVLVKVLTVHVPGLAALSTGGLVIAVHAKVVKTVPDSGDPPGGDVDDYRDIVEEESAWGDGDEFNDSKNWAMYWEIPFDAPVAP